MGFAYRLICWFQRREEFVDSTKNRAACFTAPILERGAVRRQPRGRGSRVSLKFSAALTGARKIQADPLAKEGSSPPPDVCLAAFVACATFLRKTQENVIEMSTMELAGLVCLEAANYSKHRAEGRVPRSV